MPPPPPSRPMPPPPAPPTPLVLPRKLLAPGLTHHPNASASNESLLSITRVGGEARPTETGSYCQTPLWYEPESIVERVAALRKKMAEEHIDYFVIPSEDGHLSEHVAPSEKRLQWISGFSGSAGTAIVSKRSTYLFVDSRYYIQAKCELDSDWQVLKIETPEVRDWIEWAILCPRGSKVGIDSRMISHEHATRLYKGLYERGSRLAHPRQNLIDCIWSRRPKRPKELIYVQPAESTGRGVKEKLHEVRNWIRMKNSTLGTTSVSRSASTASNARRRSPLQRRTSNASAMARTGRTLNAEDRITALFVSKLTSIAYILNLRGSDIPYDPVFAAYLLIGEDGRATLFIERDKVPKEVRNYLHENGVSIREYSDVWAFLKGKQWGEGKVIINTGTPYAASLITGSAHHIVLPPFIEEMKAVKNSVELNQMRNAYVRDGVAMVRWSAWLEQELSQDHHINEWEASEKLNDFRRQAGEEDGINMYIGSAYDNIVAIGGNAALPHYSPTESECASVSKDEPFLVDSGGKYRDGTCSTTRALHFGGPDAEQSQAFTKVLQRHIAIDTAIFPVGTNGFQLDIMAHKALRKNSLDYAGTGHGVGSFLTVQEVPESFQSSTPLQPGHVITNEPGFYKEGEFGFKIKSTLVVKEIQIPNQSEGERWFGFECLTRVPIQTRMIRASLLSEEQKKWIEDYNQDVRKVLEPYLANDERALEWLCRECSESPLSEDNDSASLSEESAVSELIFPDVSPTATVEERINQQTLVDLTGKINLDGCQIVANGGFGVVYHAQLDGKSVAVKVLGVRKNPTTGTKKETKEERRLRKEMHVWAAMDHPNIVKFYGYANGISDLPAMVSNWCENGDASYLREDSAITHERRVQLARDVTTGLAHLHSLKIIHGDLKPQNVLIDDDGNAQLCDFGLVYLDWEVVSMNTTSSYGGTARYKAHELFPSKGNPFVKPTFAGDVYALGCVIYEFVDQKLPFSDLGSVYELMDAIKEKEAPAFRPVIEQSETPYWDLLEACWNLDPQQRPNADDVLARLNNI